jgi:hypothetical protein
MMTLSIMILNILTLSIMTFNISIKYTLVIKHYGDVIKSIS